MNTESRLAQDAMRRRFAAQVRTLAEIARRRGFLVQSDMLFGCAIEAANVRNEYVVYSEIRDITRRVVSLVRKPMVTA